MQRNHRRLAGQAPSTIEIALHPGMALDLEPVHGLAVSDRHALPVSCWQRSIS